MKTHTQPLIHFGETSSKVVPLIKRVSLALLLGQTALFSTSSQAITLAQVWQAASTGSVSANANKAELNAAESMQAQANSFFEPNVFLQGSLGYQGTYQEISGARFSAPAFKQTGVDAITDASFSSKAANGLGYNWQLVATKPLYNPKKSAQQQQITLGVDIAHLQHDSKQQALFLNVANLYFDIALAQEKITVLQQQLLEVQKAQKEAKYRFKIGDSPITSVHEANENLANIQAALVSNQTELAAMKERLSLLSGIPNQQLDAHLPSAPHEKTGYINTQDMLAQATSDNLQAQINAKNVALTEQKIIEADPKSNISVNLIGKVFQQYSKGDGYGADGEINQYQHMVGVQADIPLYTGGFQTALHKTAYLEAESAKAQNLQHAQNIELQKITLEGQHASLLAQLSALNVSKTASLARKEATVLGKQVGDKTLLDVLNAQNSLATVQLNIAQTKVGLVKTELAIAQLANRIDDAVINRLSR